MPTSLNEVVYIHLILQLTGYLRTIGGMTVLTERQINFNFQLPSVLLEKRREKVVFMDRRDGSLHV